MNNKHIEAEAQETIDLVSGKIEKTTRCAAGEGRYTADRLKEKAGEVKDQLREKTAEVTDQLKEKAGQLKDRVKETAAEVKERFKQTGAAPYDGSYKNTER